jgi:hypothetical protein
MKVRNLIDYLEKFAAGEEVRSVIRKAEGIGDMGIEPSLAPLLANSDLKENIPYLEIQPNKELQGIIDQYYKDIARRLKEEIVFW